MVLESESKFIGGLFSWSWLYVYPLLRYSLLTKIVQTDGRKWLTNVTQQKFNISSARSSRIHSTQTPTTTTILLLYTIYFPTNYKNSYKEQLNQKVLENRPPQKWVFWFQKHFRNFQNSKTKLKKDPLKTQNHKISTKSTNIIKQTPPKVGILIQKTFSKFSKLKNQTQKRPPKNPKSQNFNKINKLHKTDPPKSGYSDSKNIFEIFKTQKPNSKKTP